MAQPLSGPGVGLPPPQALYPSVLGLSPYTAPTNRVSLSPAQALYLPAGAFIVACTGTVSALQWLDPVRQEWQNLLGPGAVFATSVKSDGFSYRIVNLSDSWYGGIVTAAGSGYAQATTTVTPGTGNSTWQPIIGGALGTFTVLAGGAGYGKPPLVFMPSPPAPGIAATATAALSAGAVSAITIRTAGAGYLVAPPVVIVTDPTDPNLLAGLAITQATATVALTGSGTLTGLLLINAGVLLTTAPTLTVNGAGTSATATTNPATVVAAANDVITIQPDVGP
jgi:hypothetical protein